MLKGLETKSYKKVTIFRYVQHIEDCGKVYYQFLDI